MPVISLTEDDNPSVTQPQETSTPLKATPVTGRRVSGGKINVSKVDAQHLLWKMEDRQEMAWQRAEAKVSDRSSSRGQGSGTGLPYGLPTTLPDLAAEGISAKTLGPSPAAPKQGRKRSHADDDDEITEIPVKDEPVVPPKKKKKKDKDRSKEEVPDPEIPDDGARPGSSSAKPEETVKPKPAAGPSGDLDEGAKQPKKKKKKKKQKKQKEDLDLERFREQEREARAKEMARTVHRKLQRQLDFRSVRNYRKTIPEKLLETIASSWKKNWKRKEIT